MSLIAFIRFLPSELIGSSRSDKFALKILDCLLKFHCDCLSLSPATTFRLFYCHIFISVFNQLDAQNLFYNKFYFMPLHVSSTFTHHQEVKIALNSLWYHQTYRCDDTRGCVMQLWLPDDEHMCSKHVEAWNKLIVKQKFCASCWLNTEINILRCTIRKTSKFVIY